MVLGSPLQSQNLARQVSAEKITRPPGFYKSIAVEVLEVSASLVLGYFYRMYLAGYSPIAHVALAAVGFAVLSTIGMLLQQGLLRRAGVTLLKVVALATFFYDTPPETLGIVSGAAYLFFLWGEWDGYRETEGLLEVRFFRIVRAQLKKHATALVLIGVVLYLPFWTPEKSFIPESQFQVVYNWTAATLARSYPGVTFGATMKAFAESLARRELETDERFSRLAPFDQKQAVTAATTQIIAKIEKTLEMKVDASRTVAETLYGYLTFMLDRWQKKFGAQFLLAWAVVAFLVIRGLGSIFVAVSSACAFIVYQILIAADFIHVSGESRVKEVIVYS